MITLYHGSAGGIVGEIKPISEEICDFGIGFYTATIKEYAMSSLIEEENDGSGFCYTLNIDTDPLKVFSFDDDLEFWMLFTAYNRGTIGTIDEYKKLKKRIDSLKQFDIICGLIADDRSAYAFGRFLDGTMTDKCLIECIKYFDLGLQYVFKTKKACDSIKIAEKEIINGSQYNEAAHQKRMRIGKAQDIVSDLEKKYRRTGVYFDELLEEYR